MFELLFSFYNARNYKQPQEKNYGKP